MLIDWFTVGAQALNFAVLVWLMRRFLYRPVQDALAAREKTIADTLADAKARQTQAQKDMDEFQHRSEALEQQRVGLLAQASADAGAERKRLVDAAHQAADALSASRQTELAREAASLHQALAAALQAGGQRARVRSAFELPDAQREAIQKAVDESFGTTVALQFDTAADLVAGIELSAQGLKFAWSIGDCLTALDRDVAALLTSAPAVVPDLAPAAA